MESVRTLPVLRRPVNVPARPFAALALAVPLVLLLATVPTAAETAGSPADNCTAICWVKASSPPQLVFSLTLHNNSSGSDWDSTVEWANLTFAEVASFDPAVDLAALTDTGASGVAMYNESGATAGFQPSEDLVVGVPGAWFNAGGGIYRLNISFGVEFRLRNITSSTSAYLVIRTSAGATEGTRFTAGLAVDQLNATYGNFPASAFTSGEVAIDTTPPTSSVNAITPYWWSTTPATLTAAANDSGGSGVANVDLYYEFSAVNASFGAPVFFAKDFNSPYTFNFTFPAGEGYYRFHSRANDTAGNAEAVPGSADASAAYDITDPASTVLAISGYWKTTSPLTVPWNATDNLRLANVTLEYRYRADNSSSFGNWTFFASNTTVNGTSASGNFTFTFPAGQGHYELRTIAKDAAGNSEAAGGADEAVAFDSVAPASSVNAITPYWRTVSNVTIEVTANDTTSGVAKVDLYYRSSTDNVTFGNWTFFQGDTTLPYSFNFTFPDGQRFYEFHSRANDTAGNSEGFTGVDAQCAFDNTAPTSSVSAISGYWKTTASLAVPWSATDNLQLSNVTLEYRYRADNSSSFGNWTFFASNTTLNGTSASGNFTFTFPSSDGHYEFRTVATDGAGNAESGGSADEAVGLDTIAPASSVPPNGQYWRNANVTIPANATDTTSGVTNVDLWYRYRADNASAWGNWTFFGSDSALPYEFAFNWPSGEGHYEVYSIGNDTAGNSETPPVAADASAAYDFTPPSSSVGAISGYWKTASPLTVPWSATDNLELRNVTLQYRYRADNGSAWGNWTFYASNASLSGTSANGSFAFAFPDGDGHYEFRTLAIDAATNAETAGAADEAVGFDATRPLSSVTAISPYWRNANATLPATANDNTSGVVNVELWYRYRTDNASAWGNWTSFGSDPSAPYSFSFTWPGGQGHYEFYTLATDLAGNTELAPGAADSGAAYDTTAPSSTVDPISGYWKTTYPLSVPWSATDNLELDNVTLEYRFRADNASAWGNWTFYASNTTVSGTAASGTFSFTFPEGNGHYELRTVATDAATNAETAVAADEAAGFDDVPPSSSVDPNVLYWRNVNVTLPATANDTTSGVASVNLWYRHRADNASTWGNWTFFGSDTSAPYEFSFTWPSGQGHYEFFSVATDVAGNTEAAPGAADTSAGFDMTPPTSSADPISPYWHTTSPITANATATDDLSGVKRVRLWYRHSTDNATWTNWSFYDFDETSPYSWAFPFPLGEGFYEFYTYASDQAGNVESQPGVADARAAYDFTPPSSSVTAIGPYWITSSPLSVPWTATDNLRLSNVTLQYRFKTDNSSSFGAWTFFASNTTVTGTSASGSFSFTFPNLQGIYEFRTVARDAAGNQEAGGASDEEVGFDTTPPTSSVNPISPYWGNTNPITIDVTANDNLSGVASVRLYYLYSADNTTFGNWTLFGTDPSPPFSFLFTFPDGEGYYRFHSIATDRAGLTESPPGGFDAQAGYDTTRPVSSVDPNPQYWRNTNVTVPVTASDDRSGVASVSLWYRYSTDNFTWGGWTLWATDTTAPWEFLFTWPDGEGYYEFYSIATDRATNVELAPGAADAIAGYDITAPTSFAFAIDPYWRTTSPLLVPWVAFDNLELRNVTLEYRYRANNGTSFGSWVFFASDTTVSGSFAAGTFVFPFPNGQGHYELRTIAKDGPGNTEAPPAVADASAGYDFTPPTSTVTLISPHWRNATPIPVNWTASDNVELRSVTLQYRYRPSTLVAWGAWTLYASNTSLSGIAASGSFSFAFPDGEGHYEFRTLAQDAAGNVEAAGGADEDAGYDITAASTYSDALDPYQTSASFTVTASASDALSGVAQVELFYRRDGGGWTSYGVDSTAPYAWTFDTSLTGGDGLYDFRTTSRDTAGNAESPPATPDATTRVDTKAPTTTVALSGTSGSNGWWRSNVAVTLSATDPSPSSGGLTIRYRVDAGAWTTYTGPFNVTGDGIHTLYFYTTDAAGNAEAVRSQGISIDATNPSATADAQPAYRGTRTFDVGWSGSDATSGLSSVRLYYTTDGGTVWTEFGSGFTGSPITFTAPSDGVFGFSVRGLDNAGNSEPAPSGAGSIEASTTVDTVSPTTSVSLAGTSGSNGWWRSSVTVTLSATDPSPSSGGLTIRYRVDNGSWTVYSGAFSVTGDGIHTVHFYTTDAAGNAEVQRSTEVRIDTTNPSATADAQPATRATRTFDVGWSGSDATSGLASVRLYYSTDGGSTWIEFGSGFTGSPIGFTAPSDGTFRFSVRALDNAGNSEPAPSGAGSIEATTVVDTAVPSTSIGLAGTSGSNGWWRSSVTVTLSATDPSPSSGGLTVRYRVDGGNWTTYGGAFSVAGDGVHTVDYFATDAAGNAESVRSDEVAIDATAPTAIAGAQPSTRDTRAFDVTWTGSDATSGLDIVRLYYSTNGGATWSQFGSGFSSSPIAFVAPADGTFRFNVRAVDAAGNSEAVPFSAADIEASTTVDTAVPTTTHVVTGTLGTNGWYRTGVTVTLTASDPLPSSGGLVTRYRLDDGDWTVYGGTFAVSADGTHTILYYTSDAAGNAEATKSVTLKIDTTAPTATAAALPAYRGARSFDVAWSGSDATSGLAAVALYYSVDGGSTWLLYAAGYTASPIPFTSPSDGSVRFNVVGFDIAGLNEALPSGPADTEASTFVDSVLPEASHALAGTAGLNGWYRSSVTVTLTGSDAAPASGVTALRYSLDSGAWTLYIGPLVVPTEGRHTVRYFALDAAGNAGTERVAAVDIDVTPPVSSASSLPAVTRDPLVVVRFSVSDSTSDVGSVELWVNLGPGWSLAGAYPASPAPYLAIADGSILFYTRAYDLAGNYEAVPAMEDARTFVDTAAPSTTVTLTGTGGNGDWYRSGVEVGLLAVDPAPSSGLQVTWYRLDGGPLTVYSGAFNVTAEGRHSVVFYSLDEAGNAEPTVIVEFGIDSAAPATVALGQPASTASRSLTVPFTAVDATSGIASVELWVDAGAGWFLAGNLSTSPAAYLAIADGPVYFYTRGIDVAGNWELAPGAPDAFTRVDTIAPNTLDDAPSGWSISSPVTLTLTATDGGSGPCSTLYRVDGSAWSSGTSVLVSGDGVHSVTYYTTDCAGNAETQNTATVRIDTTPPASSVSVLPAYTGSPLLTVPFTATDAASGVASVDLFVNRGAGWVLVGSVSNPASYAAVGDGPALFYTRATDVAGNLEDPPALEDASTFFDTIDPTTGSNAGAGWYTFSPVVVDLFPTDAGSGVTSTSYRVDGGLWSSGTQVSIGGDGVHLLEVFSTDAAGNAEARTTITVRIDVTDPVAAASLLPAYHTSAAVNVHWTASDATSGVAYVRLYYSDDGGSSWSPYGAASTISPISFLAPANGAYRFSVRAFDVATNSELAPATPGDIEAETVIDTAAPVTTMISAGTAGTGGFYITAVTVTLQGTDASPGSGLQGTFYALDGGATSLYTGPFTVSSAGAHTVSFFSRDLAGNAEARQTVAFQVDNVLPQGIATRQPTFQTERVFLVPYTATDDTSGVTLVRLWYTQNGGATWSQFGSGFTDSPILFVADSDGPYGFSVQALDRAGNTEAAPTSATNVETTTRVDTLAPVTTENAASGWLRVTSVQVDLNASDAGSGVFRTYYTLDGAAWTEGAIATVPGEGVHELAYYSVDNAGNAETQRTVTIRLDATAPVSLAFSAPVVVGTVIEVPFGASDLGSGVAGVEFYYSVDGATWIRHGTGLFTTSPIIFAPPSNGTFYFRTQAVDLAGNAESKTAADAQVRFSTEAPAAGIVADTGLLPWVVLLAILTLIAILLAGSAFLNLHRAIRELAARIGGKPAVQDDETEAEELQSEMLE